MSDLYLLWGEGRRTDTWMLPRQYIGDIGRVYYMWEHAVREGVSKINRGGGDICLFDPHGLVSRCESVLDFL